MSKLIKLPDGPYIKADSVVSVGKILNNPMSDSLFYKIYYNDYISRMVLSHIVSFDMVNMTKDLVESHRTSFVEMVNDNL